MFYRYVYTTSTTTTNTTMTTTTTIPIFYRPDALGDGGSGHWLVRMEWRPAG